VAVITPERSADVRNPLAELASLASTAGAVVVDGLIQRRTRIDSATYIGKGKVAELRERADASDANLVIFDNDLTPAQIRELEEATGRKVLDRSELILDIFAARARTHEARLQVELAQLQYTAPRLRGMWTHLERIAGAGGGTGAGNVGGIGTRGPGERQIEVDRRIVADRVAFLRRQIDEIDQRKTREVLSRYDEFQIALVGYTNSGKSTLMNALTGAGQLAEDKLFATLDTKTVRWRLGEGRAALLSDTVGFVRDLPHRLVASFRATLEETIHANLLLHVVDASAPNASAQIESVLKVLAELGCGDIPKLTVFNKMDVAEDVSIVQVLEQQHEPSVRISAKSGEGLDGLVAAVTAVMAGSDVDATLRAPIADGRLLATIEQRAQVRERRFDGEFVELDVRINRTHLDQMRGRHPGMIVVQSTN